MRHEPCATTAANAIGVTMPPTPRTVCWKPIAAPLLLLGAAIGTVLIDAERHAFHDDALL